MFIFQILEDLELIVSRYFICQVLLYIHIFISHDILKTAHVPIVFDYCGGSNSFLYNVLFICERVLCFWIQLMIFGIVCYTQKKVYNITGIFLYSCGRFQIDYLTDLQMNVYMDILEIYKSSSDKTYPIGNKTSHKCKMVFCKKMAIQNFNFINIMYGMWTVNLYSQL